MAYDVVIFTDSNGATVGHMKSLGAYRVASELRSNGYTTKVVDLFYQIFKDKKLTVKLLSKLIGPNTLFVGFSTTHMLSREVLINGDLRRTYPVDKDFFVRLWTTYKNRYPNLKIVVGGAHATENFIADHLVDYAVSGYSDKMVLDLASHLRNGTPIKFNINLNNPNSKVLEYDKLGQSFDFANSYTRFEECDHLQPGETICLETSRGCMFKCQFCDYPLLGRKKTDPTYIRDVNILANEFRDNWEKFKINRYFNVDSTFNETTDKLLQIHESIKKSGVDVKFHAFLRIDLLYKNPEQVRILKDMGLEAAFFGIESLNPESLKAISKPYSIKKLEEFLPYLHSEWHGHVLTTGSYIVGLPGETPDTFRGWWDWVVNYKYGLDKVRLSGLEIRDRQSWRSMFGDNAEKYGYVLHQHHNGDAKVTKMWSNEHWDNLECERLVAEIQHELRTSGKRDSIGAWQIMALQSVGYTFEELYLAPLGTWDFAETNHRVKEWKQNYINLLCQYEGIEI